MTARQRSEMWQSDPEHGIFIPRFGWADDCGRKAGRIITRRKPHMIESQYIIKGRHDCHPSPLELVQLGFR
jgi:hypothetical protein